MPLYLPQPVLGLSVKSSLPEDAVAQLFSGISFTSDRGVVHEGDTYRTYSADDTVLASVHRLFPPSLSIEEFDRRLNVASYRALCVSEMSHSTALHLSSGSSEADLSSLAALACASLSQQIVAACRELLLALKTLIVSHSRLVAEQRTIETSMYVRNGKDLVLVSARFAYRQNKRRWFACIFGCSQESLLCNLDVRRVRILQQFEHDAMRGSPMLRRILPPSPPDYRTSSAPAKLSGRVPRPEPMPEPGPELPELL